MFLRVTSCPWWLKGFLNGYTTQFPTPKSLAEAFLLEERKLDEVFTPEDFTESIN